MIVVRIAHSGDPARAGYHMGDPINAEHLAGAIDYLTEEQRTNPTSLLLLVPGQDTTMKEPTVWVYFDESGFKRRDESQGLRTLAERLRSTFPEAYSKARFIYTYRRPSDR